MKRRLLYVVNNPAFFLSHRLAPALAAREAGYEVHVATMDGSAAARVKELGFTHHVIPLTRSGRNPFVEIRAVWALYALFRRLRPHLVHLVTIKPVLYGGAAARLANVPAVVAAISGLGFVFLSPRLWTRLLRRLLLVPFYRLALGHRNSRVIFQNEADRDVMLALGAVRARQVVMMRGSGVDLDAFRMRAEPPGPVTVAMASRLLGDKGVREFVAAAQALRARGTSVRMLLAGRADPGNPASIPLDEIASWQSEGAVEVLGECGDVAGLYAQCHIVALPSYREGLPKSLMEAAACGRPVIATDVPGCRDAVLPGVSGVLVPVRDAGALADAIAVLAVDAGLRARMGAAGRELAERDFDVRVIAGDHVGLYNALT